MTLEPKVRNHVASLCSLYLQTFHPQDYRKLAELAITNYKQGGGQRQWTLQSIFAAFRREKEQQLSQDASQ